MQFKAPCNTAAPRQGAPLVFMVFQNTAWRASRCGHAMDMPCITRMSVLEKQCVTEEEAVVLEWMVPYSYMMDKNQEGALVGMAQ